MRANLSFEQRECLDAIFAWKDAGRAGFLTLGGYAGTGKTELIAYLSTVWKDCAVGALCGKAASVLRSKGVDARTIHSLIYIPWEDDFGKVHFRKRKTVEADVMVIDEASMVNEWLHDDLSSYGIPILYVGDHGQLEPIGRNPRLMERPQLRLETIHRQAEGNPILRLATAFREGRQTPYWHDPQERLRITSRNDFQDFIHDGAQVICGFNRTRHALNKLIREKKGYTSVIPQDGERIIFLANDREQGLFNGQQAEVVDYLGEYGGIVRLLVRTDDGEQIVPCLIDQFGHNLVEHRDPAFMLADYAYAITAHKAQGSEWPEVVVLEEIAPQWDARRWRYTAATRAREKLIYCR